MRTVIRNVVTRRVVYSALAALIVAAFSYVGFNYYLLAIEYKNSQTTNTYLLYAFGILNDKLKASNTLNGDLQQLLQAKVQEKEVITQQVQTLSTTVSTLDKLANTDKELLEKYSSVYFLNENYVPKYLNAINPSFLSRPEKSEQVIVGILAHLTDLMNAANEAGAPVRILSGYRSYGDQSSLKSAYKVNYGAGTANSFSADQGYSEHQLGTTVDFSTTALAGSLTGFDKTTAYTWLTDHAYQYGFTLSYPKGNIHFVFEPWHWRYVGLELAKRLHDEHKTLYDLDQREIDTYLLKFFD